MISFIDGVAIAHRHQNQRLEELKRHFPKHRILDLRENTRQFGRHRADERVRDSMTAQMASIDWQTDDQIVMIVINTHGSLEAGFTALKYIGLIGVLEDSELEVGFTDFFAPLQGRVSAELRVVMNSCTTLCADEELARQRARQIHRFFGAQTGALFGSTQLIAETRSLRLGWRRAREPILCGLVGALIWSGMNPFTEWGAMNGEDFSDSFVFFLLKAGLAWPAFSAIGVFARNRAFYQAMVREEEKQMFNRGYLVEITGPDKEHIFEVGYTKDEAQIYGYPQCPKEIVTRSEVSAD